MRLAETLPMSTQNIGFVEKIDKMSGRPSCPELYKLLLFHHILRENEEELVIMPIKIDLLCSRKDWF